MSISFPYQIDARGHTLVKSGDAHIRDLIAQVLFTSSLERVNRPTFGSGLRGLLFAPSNGALVAAIQHTIQAALQQWLGELVQVEAVQVETQDNTVSVTVQYMVRRSQQRQLAQFTQGF
jgi:uncharacterized protein